MNNLVDIIKSIFNKMPKKAKIIAGVLLSIALAGSGIAWVILGTGCESLPKVEIGGKVIISEE